MALRLELGGPSRWWSGKANVVNTSGRSSHRIYSASLCWLAKVVEWQQPNRLIAEQMACIYDSYMYHMEVLQWA